MIPIIQLFALYVVAHGHHSPGGGFQGGVIFGASFILLALSLATCRPLRRWVPENRILNLAGIRHPYLLRIRFRFVMLLGSNFLDYSILHKVMPASLPIEATLP